MNELINASDLRAKIYDIRGQKVMLDFELAELYGYTTSAFNQQVNRNIERFDNDFYFQLTDDEMVELSLSQNVIAIQTAGVKGGRSKVHAFTEQGIYMLMTVLKGNLAIKQSKALIRTFKRMKDFIIENSQNYLPQKSFAALSERVSENTNDIKNILIEQAELKSVVTSFMEEENRVEKLLLDGKYVDADFVYTGIYNSAKENIIIIDNYINLRTLVLLKDVRKGVKCTIYSKNPGKKLHTVEIEDFKKQYPEIKLEVKKPTSDIHDRFIVVDYDTPNEKLYHCGGSSKDAGAKKTVISELKFTTELKEMVTML